MRWIVPLSTILLLFLCVQVFFLDAQDIEEFEITVFGNRLSVFHTSTGEFTPVHSVSFFDGFDDPYTTLSPEQLQVITWERYPHLLRGGLRLTSLDEEGAEIRFSVNTPVELHFAEAHWPLGERFAFVQAGIVTGGDIEYPNPFWLLDTNAWLVDTAERTIEPWYWNCDTLIFRDTSQEFAVQCKANLPPFAVETHFLTIDGPTMSVDLPYRTLYTRTQRYEIGWVFTPRMDQVAIVNRHIEAPLRDEILIYRYDGSARWLATFDVQTQPVTHLFWSPSGRYLTISNGCASLTISDCLQIRDMQTGDVIWDGNRLGETISGGRYLDTSSIYWLNDESEFLLLGHFMNEDERSYLWYLSLDEHQPRARWEIPSSLRYIIDINSVNHER